MSKTEWKQLKLGEAFDLQMGKTPDRKNPRLWNNGDHKWVSISDISNSLKYISDTKETISKEAVAVSGIKRVPFNTVLMSFKLSVGKVCITSADMYTNEAIMAFLPKNGISIDKTFLYYRLLSHNWTEGVNKAVKGVTLNKATLSSTKVAIPISIAHQRHIAATLDKANELIALRKNQLEELDELAESVFYELFGDPVRNEKGWKIDVVINNAKCIVPGRDKPKSFTGKIPWITTAELVHLGYTLNSLIGLNKNEIAEVRARIIPKGSVIMTCVGDLGIVSIAGVDMVVNQQLHSFQCSENLNNVFLAYYLSMRKDYMYKMASSTTVPYMNKTVCNNIPIILPPHELQTRFATIIEKIEEQKALVRKALKESEDLFQRLMHDLFHPN